MKLISIFWNLLSPDRRPDHEKAREREFIKAANNLKTLRVTPEGGMSVDPEELREQIVSAREQLKHLVHSPGTRSGPCQAVAALDVAQEADPSVEELQKCIEVVAWRRLPNGAAVRYVCLQSTRTGKYSVATASMFPREVESLPRRIDIDPTRQVATALQDAEHHWYATVNEAVDTWDAKL